MKHKNGLNIFIKIGLLLITAALLLTIFNIAQSMKGSIDSGKALQQLEIGSGAAEWKLNPDMEMPEVEIDGIYYVGAIELPSLGLQLPVASYWDEGFAKSAPCRYTGSPYIGDLIIAGHNYRRHFGNLRNLAIGDKVFFTDVKGNSFAYKVVSLENVGGKDVERMKDGSDMWDLTLFTCNFSGQARIAVRCVELQ